MKLSIILTLFIGALTLGTPLLPLQSQNATHLAPWNWNAPSPFARALNPRLPPPIFRQTTRVAPWSRTAAFPPFALNTPEGNNTTIQARSFQHSPTASILRRRTCYCDGPNSYLFAFTYYSYPLQAIYSWSEKGSMNPLRQFEASCYGWGAHEVCYDRNFWTKDDMIIDGKRSSHDGHEMTIDLDGLDCCMQECKENFGVWSWCGPLMRFDGPHDALRTLEVHCEEKDFWFPGA